MGSLLKIVALVLTLTAVLITPSTAWYDSIFYTPKRTVNIQNILSPPTQLRYHCKSRDDDLGPRVLNPGESWHFRFKPNIFLKSTLFFCRMEWDGGSGPLYVDVYDYQRDDCVTCCWKIHQSSPCFHYCGRPEAYLCYDWNKPTLQQALNLLP